MTDEEYKIILSNLKNLNGQEVPQEFIARMLKGFHISKHAIEEMKKRTSLGELVTYKENETEISSIIDFRRTCYNIRKMIEKRILAYINTDGSVNIAITDYDYFVFAYDYKKDRWTLITWKEKSWYDKSIWQKKRMAEVGFGRKEK